MFRGDIKRGCVRAVWHLPVLAAAFAAVVGAPLAGHGAATADLSKNGVTLTVASAPDRVDVARDFEVTVKAVVPAGRSIVMPDLRDRFRDVWETGFRAFRRDLSEENEQCRVCSERRYCHGDSFHSWDHDRNEPLLCLKGILFDTEAQNPQK